MKDARREIIKKAEDKIEAARIEAAETGQKLQRGWMNQVMKKAEIEADSHPDTADEEKRKYESTKHSANYNGDNNNSIGLADGHTKLAVSERLVEKEIEDAARAHADGIHSRGEKEEWMDSYNSFIAGAFVGLQSAHARKSQAAEVAKSDERLERSVKWWMSKVYCPYKAPELRAELALEAFAEFQSILTPPALKQTPEVKSE